jgi:hypothetical protein
VESCADCLERSRESSCVAAEDERRVRRDEKCLKFEGELLGAGVGIEIAALHRFAGEALQQPQPRELLGDDRVVYGSRSGSDVNGGC